MMLPPRCPRSPRDMLQTNTFQQPSPLVPYPNKHNRNSNSQQKKHLYPSHDLRSSLDSKSRVSKYQHLRTTQQKRHALGKRRYINQLAYLDYQDKYIQVHTKYTMASKVSAMKKIKAKNQMAEFVQQEEQVGLGFEELMDYKYGRQGLNENFYFEKNQLVNDFAFCIQCDFIHNDHPQVHQRICKSKVQQNQEYDTMNPSYVYISLQRIEYSLKRTSGQEYDTLKELIRNLIRIEENSINPLKSKSQTQQFSSLQKELKYLYELYRVNASDPIIKEVCEKVLKQLYKRSLR